MSENNNLHASQESTVLLPGAGSCYKHGWHQLWKYFLEGERLARDDRLYRLKRAENSNA